MRIIPVRILSCMTSSIKKMLNWHFLPQGEDNGVFLLKHNIYFISAYSAIILISSLQKIQEWTFLKNIISTTIIIFNIDTTNTIWRIWVVNSIIYRWAFFYIQVLWSCIYNKALKKQITINLYQYSVLMIVNSAHVDPLFRDVDPPRRAGSTP